MDYEQKYKEDLEAAKGWLKIAKDNNNKIAIQIIERMFPELKSEQKSVEWSEDDDFNLSLVEALCDEKITSSTSYSTMYRVMNELKDWLKSLKDRVQPKQEWSTEDNVHLTNAIVASEKEWGAESYTVKWLKSLNPKRNF